MLHLESAYGVMNMPLWPTVTLVLYQVLSLHLQLSTWYCMWFSSLCPSLRDHSIEFVERSRIFCTRTSDSFRKFLKRQFEAVDFLVLSQKIGELRHKLQGKASRKGLPDLMTNALPLTHLVLDELWI